jgi:phosphoglycerol transferase
MGKKKRNRLGNPATVSTNASLVASVDPGKAVTGKPEVSRKSTKNFWDSQAFEWLALAIGSAIAFWYLTVRLTGVTVSVLIDEYVYVLDAHYKAFSESGYPNHLFQLIYSSTKVCGPEFYECARSINAGFVVASGIVVYFLAKYLASGKKIFGVAGWLVTILGTFGTYTAYFMPEAIFNFLMVLFIYGLIRFGNSDRILTWLALGSLLGIAALAKPHALFVVPAIVIFIFLSVWSTKQTILKSSLLRMGTFLAALLVSKLGLGYLIAGPNGFSLFGSYGYAVASGEAVAETLNTNTWLNVPQTALGQTLMIVMILGVALPVALVGLLRVLKKDEELFAANKFRALFGIALLNMMAVSALFEAWQNLNTWMHTRYYSYLIPLAVLVLVEAYVRRDAERTNLTKRIIVGIFVVLSIYALFTQGIPFGANWIDAPDFFMQIKNLEISSILIIVALGLSIFWLWNSKTSMAIAIAVSVFASGYAGLHTTNFLSDTFGKGDAYQHIGRLLSNYLPQEELDKTVLFGNDGVLMQRTLFYSLSGGATAMGGTHAEFEPAAINPDTKWFLVFGEALPQLGQPHLTGTGYQLYSLAGEPVTQPRNTELKEFSNNCLDSANAGWACGSGTTLTLETSFPANAKVDLVFEVGESLAGTDLEFTLGESTGVVTVPGGTFAVSLTFQNAAEASELLITSKTTGVANQAGEQKMIRPVSVNVE